MTSGKIEQAEGSYTIVFLRETGMLLVCEPDGVDVEAAIANDEQTAHIDVDRDAVVILEGVTLTDDVDNEADDVVYRAGDNLGWLGDTAGRTYDYAVRRT